MTEDKIFRELRKISKVLTLANARMIELEISKVATTEDRRKMWALIDGQRTSKDIANELKITQRAVQYFLKDAKVADFIEYGENDAPRKTLEYVPPSWIELLKDGESSTPSTQKSPIESSLDEFQKSEEEKKDA